MCDLSPPRRREIGRCALRWLMGLVLAGLCWQPAYGQDPILSQYFMNKPYLNPAFTGYDGGITVNSSWREQWFRIAGRNSGYRTRMIGAAMNVPGLQSGFGLQYFNHVEGPGSLTWQRAGISYAFRTRDCGDRYPRSELNLGMRVSANWTGLQQPDAFTYGDQLDPIQGAIYQTGANLAFDGIPPRPFMDLDVGAVYLQRLNRRNEKANNDYLRVGLAINHLPGREIDNLGFFDGLPVRTTFHVDWMIRQNGFELIPMLKLENQSATSLFIPGSDDRYWFWHHQLGVVGKVSNDRNGIWFGTWYQGRLIPGDPQVGQTGLMLVDMYGIGANVHSLALAVGGEIPLEKGTGYGEPGQLLRFGLSYDYQFTGLTNDGSGTVEFSLTLQLNEAFDRVTSCRGVCAF